MADVRRLIDQFKYQGAMTRADYDGIIQEIQADGMVDKEEGEQLQRLMAMVNSGEIKILDDAGEVEKIAKAKRVEAATKYAPPTKKKSAGPSAQAPRNAAPKAAPAGSDDGPLTLDSVMSDTPKRKKAPQRLTAADMMREKVDLELSDEQPGAAAEAPPPPLEEPAAEASAGYAGFDPESNAFERAPAEPPPGSVSSSSVLNQTQSEDGYSAVADLDYASEGSPAFELASSRFLKVNLRETVWMKVGAMVAYSGTVRFTRESVFEHGVSKMLKRSLTGEGTDLTRATGAGTLYLADHGKMVTVYKLHGDTIVVNGNDLFAFENTVSWDITSMKRLAAMWAGGLFNVTLSGSGMVAVTTHFDPVRVKVSPGKPVFTDPNATVAWSGTLKPTIKSDISMGTMIGRTSGETFQLKFEGTGDLLIQPFQEGVSEHTDASG